MTIDKSYNTKNNARPGGSEWDVGGVLNVNPGGVINIETGGMLLESVADALTAKAGGGQSGATALSALINAVTTVATAADSVVLPASTGIVGAVITAINEGANAMQVFGSGTDTINGVAYGTGVSVPAGKTASFFAMRAGAWRMQLSA